MNIYKNKIFKSITIILSTIYSLIVPFSVIFMVVSLVFIDSPNAGKDFQSKLFYTSVISIPVILSVVVIASIVSLIMKAYKRAFIFSLVPIIILIVFQFVKWLNVAF